MSPHVDGHAGANRYPTPPKISASHDLEAIACWLREYLRSPHTERDPLADRGREDDDAFAASNR